MGKGTCRQACVRGAGLDLASRGFGITTILAFDLATDPVLRAFYQDLVKLGGAENDAEDFILDKPELQIPIKMACSLFR